MKNLIKKILRESDDWEWVRNIDPRPEIELGRLYDVHNEHIEEFLQAVENYGKGIRWASDEKPTRINLEKDLERGSTVIEIKWNGQMMYWSDWNDYYYKAAEIVKYSGIIKWPNILENINESDGLQWIKDIEINPWIEYDGIHFDIEPSREDLSKYIEMALKTVDIDKPELWADYGNDVTSIIGYVNNKDSCYLVIDNNKFLSYGTKLDYWPNNNVNIIKYSELKGLNKLTESDHLQWIKDIEPAKIEDNTKYNVKYEHLYDFLAMVEKEQPTFRWRNEIKPTDFELPRDYNKNPPKYIKIRIKEGMLTFNMLVRQLVGHPPIDPSDTINWP
jgi:hypothetical protein